MGNIDVAEQSIQKILDATGVISDNITHLSATGEEVYRHTLCAIYILCSFIFVLQRIEVFFFYHNRYRSCGSESPER